MEGNYGYSDGIPVGLLDPVSCRNKRYTNSMAAIINRRRKWKAKKRVRVALSTEKPPQIHSMRSVLMKGIAESKFVMTVTSQKGIRPHGNT